MSVEENKVAFKRFVDELFNKGDLSVIPELIDPNHVMHTARGNVEGQESVKQYIISVRTAFPDINTIIDDMVCEGDKIAAYLTWTGTHKGEWMNIAPTNKKITISGAWFYQYKDGKLIESKGLSQALSMYQQLGVTPPTS